MSTVDQVRSIYRSAATSASTPIARVTTPHAAPKVGTSTAGTAGPTAVDSVQISGRATMLNRLFHGDSTAQPKSAYGPQPSSGLVFNYLTATDRDALSTLYDTAREQGVDLKRVDEIAFDLADYRSVPPEIMVDAVGKTFNEHGQPVVFEFSPDDEAAAQRILTSKAIKDSALPEDFLRQRLNPGLAPMGASDFNALESLVYATSRTGSNGESDPSAVLAPRPRQRLALLQAAGAVLTPQQVLGGMGHSTSGGQDRFAAFASRLRGAAASLTDNDKDTLGSLYTSTAEAYGANSPQMRDVDRIARTLVALRTGGEDSTIHLWQWLLDSEEDTTRPTPH
ncbi:hypothetical protein [Kineococcus rubinsiae]|uniref:hypothetical protein n=1 Tax=Kineococcus rubinsiae TaxID=2609562 RepID=UPI001431A433|nr:hypothetical protein [Kineococcus rubinsiae]NIZ90306.1 hypothetical protein [Kineococcus rubinsiae]